MLRRSVVLLFAILVLSALTLSASAKHGYPACDPGVMQSSGYIDIPGIGNTKKHYFYWLFAPRHWPTDGSEPPVVLWMTGGPGCSSGLALTLELGPCLMDETTGKLNYNAYGWNDNAYLLFVDQTAGVGYSYADKINWDHNESEAADDMYNFLQGFAKKFKSPSITGKNDFYVIGESYAGHYVPSVGYRILQGNQRGDGPHINLKAVAIGNGYTDTYTQYPAYLEYATDFCQEKLGKPCISDEVRAKMASILPDCLALIKECNRGATDTSTGACATAFTRCQEYESLFSTSGLNSMDIRKPCIGELCYSMDHTTAFYAREDVKAALGAKLDQVWSTCNNDVADVFINDQHRNFNWTVPPLLAAQIPVVIYVGDMDYSCNWIGNKRWTMALEWPGKAGFNAAADVPFSVAGRVAGTERRYGNFTYIQIYDAGHMVPMDQPEVALFMLHKIVKNERMIES